MSYFEKQISSDTAYSGKILSLTVDKVELQTGRVTTREVVWHSGAVGVVAIDGDDIILVRQFRYPFSRELLEIPAGKLEKDEEPIACAARELEEETGFRSENLEFLMTVNTTVAFCDEKIGVYIAKDLIPSKQNLDADESIDVEEWEVKDLLEMISSGKMTDAKTMAAILAYAQREGIR